MARVWSTQQIAIFSSFEKGTGNLVVVARAGVGKTTTIIEGINHSPAEKIMLCAFNKRIADELTAKLSNPRAESKTLHSIGFRFITRNWTKVRVDNDRGRRIAQQIMGHEVPDPMLNNVVKLTSLAKGMCPFPKLDEIVDIAYEFDLAPDQEWIEDGWSPERLASYAMKCMDKACEKDGTIDFDDMVFIPLRNRWVRGSWDLIVVDEAQDMNAAQLLLAQKAVKKGGRIVVVGDDRQAIYGFRGADSGSIARLKKELSAVELGLTITYRCPKQIVELAQKIVPDFMAAANAPEGTIINIMKDKLVAMAGPHDFILSRKNAPLAGVCLALLRAGKRAKIQGKDIGRGLINLVKKINGKSMPDFHARLTKWEEREVKRLLASGKKSAEARIEYINDQAETLRELAEGLSGVKELTTRIDNLFADVEGKNDAIMCSTVHKAKGLEADRVFILESTLRRGGSIEENNIEYVAITRAKKELVWVNDPISVEA